MKPILSTYQGNSEESMKRLFARAGLAILLVIAPRIAGATNYYESLLGDISGVPAAPSMWNLDAGPNILHGSAGTSSDYDILSLTIPAGHQLDSLTLDAYQNQGRASFLGLQSGSTWTAGLGNEVDGQALLGYDLFDVGLVGTNRLPDIALMGNTMSPQFTPPLGSGTYAMLLQDTGSAFNYQFTFNVSAVPEPATLSLAAIGLLAIGRLARRK
jgi:hypothetical protein